MHLEIRTAAGAVVEQDFAKREHGVWLYETATAAPANEALTITAIARDRPDHTGAPTVSV